MIKSWKLFQEAEKQPTEEFKYEIDEIEDYFLHLSELHGYRVNISRGYKVGSSKYLSDPNRGNKPAKGKLAYRVHIQKTLVTTGTKLEILKTYSEKVGSIYTDINNVIKRMPFNFKILPSFSFKRNLFWMDIVLIETDETGKEKVSIDQFKTLSDKLAKVSWAVGKAAGGGARWNSKYMVVPYRDGQGAKTSFGLDSPPINQIYLMPNSYRFTQDKMTNEEMILHYDSVIEKLDDAKELDEIYFDRSIVYLEATGNDQRTGRPLAPFQLPVLKVTYEAPDFQWADKLANYNPEEEIQDEDEAQEEVKESIIYKGRNLYILHEAHVTL